LVLPREFAADLKKTRRRPRLDGISMSRNIVSAKARVANGGVYNPDSSHTGRYNNARSDGGQDVPVPDTTSASCIFSDATNRTIEAKLNRSGEARQAYTKYLELAPDSKEAPDVKKRLAALPRSP